MSFWGGGTRIPRPHAPVLQAYAGVTQRRMATAPPLRSLAGGPAVRLVDAQIAWIDSGHRSTDPGSPVRRWASGR
jgi:hypothetical protein